MTDLYDATSAQLFGVLRRMLPDRAAAEEVLQEVYVQVWRSAKSFDAARGSAWSWLFLLARSRAVDRLRAERSYRDTMEGFALEPEPAGATPSPEAEAARGERRGLVRRALAELPAEQRAALELAFFTGLTHREISERTSTPLGTVKTRIRAAMSKLEGALGPVLEKG